jgi:hypothetical protein
MNDAERRRNVRIRAMSDEDLLNLVCASDFREDVTSGEYAAFANMRANQETLTLKQRAWAEEVARRVVPFDARDVPRGREVETPAVLRNLPKSPPGRR